MDNFFKNLKEKLSVDNLVNLMKDSVGQQKHEEVKKTLEKIDSNVLNPEELTTKMNAVVAEQSNQIIEEVANPVSEDSVKILEQSNITVVLQKSNHSVKDDNNSIKDDISKESKEEISNMEEDDIDPVWDI